ncbi:hypothetical protein D3C87_1597290 [compost metagenome]
MPGRAFDAREVVTTGHRDLECPAIDATDEQTGQTVHHRDHRILDGFNSRLDVVVFHRCGANWHAVVAENVICGRFIRLGAVIALRIAEKLDRIARIGQQRTEHHTV